MPRDQFPLDAATLTSRFRAIRERFIALAAPFSAEDLCVQTMADVSPGKWHLAHVTWFWETFLLKAAADYAEFDPRFSFLFNSYYEAVGARHARPERGFLTRPGLDEVMAYRRHVDAAVERWLQSASSDDIAARLDVLLTGFAHEEQHQELFLTDIKHVLSRNSFPEAAFAADRFDEAAPLKPRAPAPDWVRFEGGRHSFGHGGPDFAFDHEGPEHEAVLTPFALASHPVTNAQFLAFMEDGGYERPEFWLSDGWAVIQDEARSHPYYWRRDGAGWMEFTLHGLAALDPDAPASHLDFYEADAFAAWAGFRLPEEREWEFAARSYDPERGRWADPAGRLHPRSPAGEGPLLGLFGEVWEWTRSAYSPYPGYRAPAGAIGEYNGKFMCGQFVLRGGSAATPPGHVRATYRNFFPPGARWQMTGLRLARDI